MSHTSHSSQSATKIIDLNDLRIFAYVTSLTSFTLAADALQIHKSSVSRSVARLEEMLETPLLERPTRRVLLTQRGADLKAQCIEMLSCVNEAIDVVRGEAVTAVPDRPSAVRSQRRVTSSVPAQARMTVGRGLRQGSGHLGIAA